MTKKKKTEEITTQERRDAIEETLNAFSVTIRAINIKSFSDHKTVAIKLYPFDHAQRGNDNFMTLTIQFKDNITNDALCLGVLRVFEHELEDYIKDGDQNFTDDSIMDAPGNEVTKYLTASLYKDADEAELEKTRSLKDIIDGLEMITMELNHTLFSVANAIFLEEHDDLVKNTEQDLMHDIINDQFVQFIKRQWLQNHTSVAPDIGYAAIDFDFVKKFADFVSEYGNCVVFSDFDDDGVKKLQDFICDGLGISKEDRKPEKSK